MATSSSELLLLQNGLRPEAYAALKAVRRILVHPGLAHVDDILATALALAFGVPHDATILRATPTADDLESLETLVLDVGLAYDPTHLNFDHHQRGRTEAPKCAYVLLSEWLGVGELLSNLFPWYQTWNLIDVMGPYATAKSLGLKADALAGFVGHPLGEWVIRHFADNAEFRAKVALGLAKEIDKTVRSWFALAETAVNIDIAGLPVADMRASRTDEISRASEAWVRRYHSACLVTNDNRGTGLTFLRCQDDPRLDFSRCADKPYTLFAHPGGFIVKTRSRDDSLTEVLKDARQNG